LKNFKHFYICFFSLIIIAQILIGPYIYAEPLSTAPQAQQSAQFDIPTPCAILIDSKSGQILYEKNSHQKMFPASITKIMTATLALEKGDLQSTVIMSNKAVSDIEPDSSNAGLMPGEQLTLEQLLYAMLLNSANEAANAISENIGGDKEEFAKMMTQRAKELGAQNTNFANPNGLHNPEHYTTAYDMSMIAKHAMTIPKFREIVSTYKYILPPTNKMPKEKELYNSNRLISINSNYRYPYAIGIKTGYTTIAGSTLVSAAKKDDMELISVVMNSPIDSTGSHMYIDSRAMFEYGFNNFEIAKLIKKNDSIKTIKVRHSSEWINALAQDDFSYLVPRGTNTNVFKKNIELNTLYAPVKKGDVIGIITFEKDNKVVGKVNLIASSDVDKSFLSFLNMPKNKTFLSITWLIIKWVLFILLSLFIFLVLILIIYNKIRIYKRKRKKKLNI
jgi:D-alanyl-D-alanine carboxypeptidase (penicillin-binding protein 5/6)